MSATPSTIRGVIFSRRKNAAAMTMTTRSMP